MARRLTAEQWAIVDRILTAERRALMSRVKSRARYLRRRDAAAARELLRVAQWLHGVGRARGL